MALELEGTDENLFNANRYVDEGITERQRKEQEIYIAGSDFDMRTDSQARDKSFGFLKNTGTQEETYKGIVLPEGATITEVALYGSSGEVWSFIENTDGGTGTSVVDEANINTRQKINLVVTKGKLYFFFSNLNQNKYIYRAIVRYVI